MCCGRREGRLVICGWRETTAVGGRSGKSESVGHVAGGGAVGSC